MRGKRDDQNLIVGLDIGTSKVVTVVGTISPEDTVEVVGLGMTPSRGLKRGVVVDIESTVESIRRAVEEAELMAGCEINHVYAGIAGGHIRSLNSHGIVAITDKEVTSFDVERVIDAARAVAIPADQKLLHILPQEFLVDSEVGIRVPVGMSGVRLEAKVHLVTCAVSSAQNIVKCIQRCGLDVQDLVLEQLASSYAVLTEDEKELGICLLDIGGGTSDIAVFLRRCDTAYGGDTHCRRAGDQRHRRFAAHTDAACRGNQDQVRLRAVAARQSGRDDRGSERRRPATPTTGAADPGGGGRIPLRGALYAGSG